MGYWGIRAEQSDFATGAVGVAILSIKRKMFEEIDLVLQKKHPEQSIVSSLVCLRLLGKRFPKNLSVHFRKKHYQEVKDAFYEWYDLVKKRIPEEYRSGLLEEAGREFQLFEDEILQRYKRS